LVHSDEIGVKMQFFYNYNIKNRDRFQYERFSEWEEGFYDVLNSSFLSTINELEIAGEFLVTKDEMRIDIISYRIYGSTKYWWILLEFNDIIDQFTIKTGDLLKFFSLTDLEKKYAELTKKQNLLGN